MSIRLGVALTLLSLAVLAAGQAPSMETDTGLAVLAGGGATFWLGLGLVFHEVYRRTGCPQRVSVLRAAAAMASTGAAALSIVYPSLAAPLPQGEQAALQARQVVGHSVFRLGVIERVSSAQVDRFRQEAPPRATIIVVTLDVGTVRLHADCTALAELAPLRRRCPSEPTPVKDVLQPIDRLRVTMGWLFGEGVEVTTQRPDYAHLDGLLVVNPDGRPGFEAIAQEAESIFAAPFFERPGDPWLGASYQRSENAQWTRLVGLWIAFAFCLAGLAIRSRPGRGAFDAVAKIAPLPIGGVAGTWFWILLVSIYPTGDPGPWDFLLWLSLGTVFLGLAAIGAPALDFGGAHNDR